MKDPAGPADLPGPDPRVSGIDPVLLGQGETSYVQASCPVCAAPRAMLRTVRLDVPYFGEIFETIFLCASCGFRHTDTLIPRISEPVEFVVHVEREADLSIRAVKSSSATVAVPELGLLWEPGPASIAQVTNVEGLLRHFDDAVARAIALFGTDDVRRKGERIRAALDDIIESRRSSDLVLKDPYGNSALIDPGGRVRRRTLEAAEASELMTGEYVFEVGQGGAVGLRPAPGPGPA